MSDSLWKACLLPSHLTQGRKGPCMEVSLFSISDLASLAPHSLMSRPPVSERPSVVRKEAILELVTGLLFLHIHLQVYTYIYLPSSYIHTQTHTSSEVHMHTLCIHTHILCMHTTLMTHSFYMCTHICTHTSSSFVHIHTLHMYTHIFLYTHIPSYTHTHLIYTHPHVHTCSGLWERQWRP